jgi:hypothetical protein
VLNRHSFPTSPPAAEHGHPAPHSPASALLRPPSTGTIKIRILFAFDPWRSAILLVAGSNEGRWNRWYARATPRAEQLYEVYLKERAEEDAGR